MRRDWEMIRVIGGLSVLLVLLVAFWYWTLVRGCDKACGLEGHEAHYIWEAGCWCIDDDGHAYNPKDAR